MKRRISSLMTFPFKVIFPAVWITAFGLGTLAVFFGSSKSIGVGAPPKVAILSAWIMGSAFIYWSCIRLKEVSVDEHYLYISNFIKEVNIPLSAISDVTENRWVNIHPVTIHLKSPSPFGSKIVFMPHTRIFAFFSSHPVVAELKELARPGGTGDNLIG